MMGRKLADRIRRFVGVVGTTALFMAPPGGCPSTAVEEMAADAAADDLSSVIDFSRLDRSINQPIQE